MEAWNQRVRMDPREFLRRLTDRLDGHFRLELKGERDKISYTLLNLDRIDHPNIAGIWTADRMFDFSIRDVHHDALELPGELQARRIARQLFRNSMLLYDRLRLRSISMYADAEVGGYAWARYRFLPNNQSEWD